MVSGKIRYKLIGSNTAIRLAIDLFVYEVIRTKYIFLLVVSEDGVEEWSGGSGVEWN